MDLSEIPVSEIMTSDVVTVSPSQKLIDVKHIFEKKNFHHHIPVASEGKLLGMITLMDFLFAIKNATLSDNDETYHKVLVRDIMRAHPVTILSSSSLKDAGEILAEGNIHAIVICDKGLIKGIVSTADVIRYFLSVHKS